METRSITLYSRPECELCVEALEALRQIAAASPTPLVISEINVEGDPVLHQRLLTEIPAVEYGGNSSHTQRVGCALQRSSPTLMTRCSMSEVSLLTAVAAGLLSFLSPCVLPLVPAYLGRLASLANGESATLHALLFVSGFTALFTLLGVGAAYAGGALGSVLPILQLPLARCLLRWLAPCRHCAHPDP